MSGAARGRELARFAHPATKLAPFRHPLRSELRAFNGRKLGDVGGLLLTDLRPCRGTRNYHLPKKMCPGQRPRAVAVPQSANRRLWTVQSLQGNNRGATPGGANRANWYANRRPVTSMILLKQQ